MDLGDRQWRASFRIETHLAVGRTFSEEFIRNFLTTREPTFCYVFLREHERIATGQDRARRRGRSEQGERADCASRAIGSTLPKTGENAEVIAADSGSGQEQDQAVAPEAAPLGSKIKEPLLKLQRPGAA